MAAENSRLRRPLSRVTGLLLTLASISFTSPLLAEELSAKTENYIFAASEALRDGEPALALTLLKRARAEDPQSCILNEYLCRTSLALHSLDDARRYLASFSACMSPTDDPIRKELAALLATAEASAPPPAAEPPRAPVQAATTPTPPPARVPPPPKASPQRQKAHPGAVIAWVAGSVGILTGGAATGTYIASRGWKERGEKETYENWAPLNHASLISAGVGGSVALGGLIWALVDKGPDSSSALTPSMRFEPATKGSAFTATWTF